MFVVVIDRLRQRVMTTLRILFLLALVAVLAGQVFGLFKAGEALRYGSYPAGTAKTAPGTTDNPAGGILGTLARDLRHFYMGHD
ncbi:MAG: hypothetical protein M0Z41_15955 [Peptococcaceae bacterium]|jgi:hypothetical protein|nr:hypothetical protein [Peptococcaceae bacterium]